MCLFDYFVGFERKQSGEGAKRVDEEERIRKKAEEEERVREGRRKERGRKREWVNEWEGGFIENERTFLV